MQHNSLIVVPAPEGFDVSRPDFAYSVDGCFHLINGFGYLPPECRDHEFYEDRDTSYYEWHSRGIHAHEVNSALSRLGQKSMVDRTPLELLWMQSRLTARQDFVDFLVAEWRGRSFMFGGNADAYCVRGWISKGDCRTGLERRQATADMAIKFWSGQPKEETASAFGILDFDK